MQESLEDHLRRVTRNFTARLPEDEVLSLGRDLARELARAHQESRHPEMEPSAIPMIDGRPRLSGGTATGDVGDDLFELGALLNALASGTPPDVAWRLDGPPPPQASTLARRAVLAGLGSPRRDGRFPAAAAAAEAFEAVLGSPEGPAAWPLFRGDAARTGSRPGSVWTGLAAAWEAQEGAIVASPVVTPTLVLVPVADGRLLFLDRSTGREIHELRLASAIESSPALAGRILHVGTDDGELVAVDVVDGSERYRVRLGQVVRSSPLPVGERLLVGVVEGKAAGSLVALDARGKTLWKRKLAPIFSSPALAGSRVLVGGDDGALYALDPEQGTLLWSHALGGKVRATPAVMGETALVGDFGGRLVAVSVVDGARIWTLDLGHPLYSSPCVARDVCIVGCHEGHIHGVDHATGKERFVVTTRGPVVSSAVAVGDRIVIGSTDGDLYVMDASGTVLQRAAVGAGIESSPAFDRDLLFVGSGRGLHALRLTT